MRDHLTGRCDESYIVTTKVGSKVLIFMYYYSNLYVLNAFWILTSAHLGSKLGGLIHKRFFLTTLYILFAQKKFFSDENKNSGLELLRFHVGQMSKTAGILLIELLTSAIYLLFVLYLRSCFKNIKYAIWIKYSRHALSDTFFGDEKLCH